MSSFMYGLRVTPSEEIILNKILTETDKIAKVRHFRAVHAIARRNNVDMERAETIYRTNYNIVRDLNQNSSNGDYFLGKNGAVCKRLSGRACPIIRELPDEDIFMSGIKKTPKTGFGKFADKIRNFVKTISAFFTLN